METAREDGRLLSERYLDLADDADDAAAEGRRGTAKSW